MSETTRLTVETVWRFLKKLKTELPYDPAIPLLYISEKNKSINSERHMHPSIQSSILGGSVVKSLPANLGDTGLILVSGRSPGGKIGNPLQYSCLDKNPMDRRAWWATVHGCKVSDTTGQLSMHACKSVQRGTDQEPCIHRWCNFTEDRKTTQVPSTDQWIKKME